MCELLYLPNHNEEVLLSVLNNRVRNGIYYNTVGVEVAGCTGRAKKVGPQTHDYNYVKS